ncbi:UPF0696 protein C11orf68 homolog [Ptychodera flava]|uniref:UPF0696 protein C11orf68 homolog n=1 Tax=Ptychodera flava TaxID=63121 RepID=UPI00396A9CCD
MEEPHSLKAYRLQNDERSEDAMDGAASMDASCHGSRQHWTAADYALESKAADEDDWISFDPKEPGNDINDFLANNRPSALCRSNKIGWIYVESPKDWRSGHEPDIDGLEEDWERLKSSGRSINFYTIMQLSKSHQMTLGKWLMHIPTGFQADYAWEKIAKATARGDLGCAAKVSPYDSSQTNYQHVICVYNEDCTNEEQIKDLEDKIRKNAGIKCHLNYKPEVYTYIGVYRRNEWNLRPTIYESVYTLHKGSEVKVLYD